MLVREVDMRTGCIGKWTARATKSLVMEGGLPTGNRCRQTAPLERQVQRLLALNRRPMAKRWPSLLERTTCSVISKGYPTGVGASKETFQRGVRCKRVGSKMGKLLM